VNFRTHCSITSYLGSTASCLGLIFALLATSPAPAGVLDGDGIGVYGDSLSFEYSSWVPYSTGWGYPLFSNGHQFNWVDHLSMSGYNFGTPGVPGDFYGNSFTHHDYAVALGGATSEGLSDQVTQLTPFLAANQVKLTVLGIGGNEFTLGGYDMIYTRAANVSYNPLVDPDVQSLMDQIVNNITAGIDATLAANPNERMIMLTVPDIGATTDPHVVSGRDPPQ